MVEIIWSEPALSDLDAIADYIALESPTAAAELVRRVFPHIEQLAAQKRKSSQGTRTIPLPAEH
jgi:plasmid stabilization system protein ParE